MKSLVRVGLVLTLWLNPLMGLRTDPQLSMAQTKSSVAKALKKFEFDEKKSSGTIASGNLVVRVSHQKVNPKDGKNIVALIEIDSANKTRTKLTTPISRFISTIVYLVELDNTNQYPEVMYSIYTGDGAHCCYGVGIASFSAETQAWKVIQLGDMRVDNTLVFEGSSSLEPKDIDSDGIYELVGWDSRFLYRFSSYASSRAPYLIWRLQNGKLINVTFESKYAPFHRNQANKYLQEIQKEARSKDSLGTDINGIIAGYAATKAILGEFDSAVPIIAKYHKPTEWSECLGSYMEDGRCKGRLVQFNSFPKALKYFLEKLGYL